MTLEIKSDRRNLTFGSGEPAISHEKAVEIVKEYARLMEIAEMSKVACASCDYDNNGTCDLHIVPEQCHKATAIAESFYNAGYRKQSGWISVDDRLPETYEDVLCFDRRSVIIDFICSDGTWCGIHDKPITHWMPLPEPPRMKEGASDDRN